MPMFRSFARPSRAARLVVPSLLTALVAAGSACGSSCPEGYAEHDGECVDIDECTATDPKDRHECGPNATCTNLPGGYSCAFHHEDEPR